MKLKIISVISHLYLFLSKTKLSFVVTLVCRSVRVASHKSVSSCLVSSARVDPASLQQLLEQHRYYCYCSAVPQSISAWRPPNICKRIQIFDHLLVPRSNRPPEGHHDLLRSLQRGQTLPHSRAGWRRRRQISFDFAVRSAQFHWLPWSYHRGCLPTEDGHR